MAGSRAITDECTPIFGQIEDFFGCANGVFFSRKTGINLIGTGNVFGRKLQFRLDLVDCSRVGNLPVDI